MNKIFKTVITAIIFTALAWSCSEQPKGKKFTGDFGNENSRYRNTETKNLSPYAIFGDSSFVLMTEAERTGKHSLIIPNKSQDPRYSKIEISLNTGQVKVFGLNGNLVEDFILPPEILARFLSVDPRAEKYYDMSPYNYVANNPIRNIDPNGDTIAVAIGGTNYKYIEGSFYDRSGTVFNPEEGTFGHGILTALNDIAGGGEFGKNFIGQLTSMSEYVTIGESKYGRNVTAGAKVHAELGEIQSANTQKGFQPIPFDIILGHELSHAYSNVKGATFGDWTTIPTAKGPKTLSTSEIYASHIENILRNEQGHPLRTHYSPYGDGSPVPNTRLIDSKGRSLYFQSGVTDFGATTNKRVKSKLRYGY